MTNTPRRFDENPNTTTNLQKDSTEYFGISQSGASKVIKTADAFTKANVGLSEVDNTSDANKPVSVAQQTALDLKADESDVTTALDLKANKSDTYTKGEVDIELAKKADIVQEDWIEPTLLNGWTGTCKYAKNSLGIVNLSFDGVIGISNYLTVVLNVLDKYSPLSTKPIIARDSSISGRNIVDLYMIGNSIRYTGGGSTGMSIGFNITYYAGV